MTCDSKINLFDNDLGFCGEIFVLKGIIFQCE